MAYTRFASTGDTDTPAFPHRPAGSPGFFVNSVQVAPPSVDLNRPLPGPPLERECGVRDTSQSAAYNVSGAFGSIERSTAPVLASRNSTRSHVLPPSRDR